MIMFWNYGVCWGYINDDVYIIVQPGKRTTLSFPGYVFGSNNAFYAHPSAIDLSGKDIMCWYNLVFQWFGELILSMLGSIVGFKLTFRGGEVALSIYITGIFHCIYLYHIHRHMIAE